MNTITVIGNVGKEPELRYTQSGKAVAEFTVADTHGKDDERHKHLTHLATLVVEEARRG